MVNTERARGGAARIAVTLTNAINDFTSAKAVLFHSSDKEVLPRFHGLKKFGSRQLNALVSRVAGSEPVLDMGVANRIIQLSASADVLHLHNLHGYYLDYRRLLSEWKDRPVVWTLHDTWSITGRCGANGACGEWSKGCNPCPNRGLYPAAWIDHAADDFKAKTELFVRMKNLWLVSPSEWLRRLAAVRGYDTDRITVIPNPTDFSSATPLTRNEARTALNLPVGKFIALFVASNCNDPFKGYADFCNAVASTEATGIAIGRLATHPSRTVINVGPISDRGVLSTYYAAADLFVIPSYADNYPTTIIESFSNGTPVVGYATGGIPSMLENDFGLAIPTGNLDALKLELRSAIATGPKGEKKSAAIIKMAAQWSSAQIAQRYWDLYSKVVLSAVGCPSGEGA